MCAGLLRIETKLAIQDPLDGATNGVTDAQSRISQKKHEHAQSPSVLLAVALNRFDAIASSFQNFSHLILRERKRRPHCDSRALHFLGDVLGDPSVVVSETEKAAQPLKLL